MVKFIFYSWQHLNSYHVVAVKGKDFTVTLIRCPSFVIDSHYLKDSLIDRYSNIFLYSLELA